MAKQYADKQAVARLRKNLTTLTVSALSRRLQLENEASKKELMAAAKRLDELRHSKTHLGQEPPTLEVFKRVEAEYATIKRKLKEAKLL